MKYLLSSLMVMIAGTAMAQAPQAGARYVAMGSSYAAGPGVGMPDPSGSACARSSTNYAHLVAARHHLNLVDVSCSSAVTENILDHGQHGLPAQIEAVTPDTKLVSILIGGNDIDYVGNLLGLSCRDTNGQNCHVADQSDVERKMAALPASLDRVIAAVRQRAPSARIILVGYLPAVAAAGPGDCAALPLTPADAARVRDVAVRLAQIIGGAAQRNNTGIVRSTMVGAGHEVCSADPYLAGFHPAANPGWHGPVAYHPNQAGMNRIAAALDEAIGR